MFVTQLVFQSLSFLGLFLKRFLLLNPLCDGKFLVECIESFFLLDTAHASQPLLCFAMPSNVQGWEMKLVFKTGRNAVRGWDILCRRSDGKCNLSELDVCPNGGQLTQWHAIEHLRSKLKRIGLLRLMFGRRVVRSASVRQTAPLPKRNLSRGHACFDAIVFAFRFAPLRSCRELPSPVVLFAGPLCKKFRREIPRCTANSFPTSPAIAN